MKKTLDIKKLILLNMPYILLGLFATNFGEAWRMAQGTDASEKFLSLVAVLPGALQSFWPSLHPLDLLVGLCCGVGLRLAVYLKSKNAKKYRHGLEYGSARWGTREDIASYRQKHESDFIIADAAARYFRENGISKLPSYKALQAEIESLIQEKNSGYNDYRAKREEYRRLQTVKGNIDQILHRERKPVKRQEQER